MAKRIQMQKNRYINMKKMLDLAKLPNDPGVQVGDDISFLSITCVPTVLSAWTMIVCGKTIDI